MRKINILFGLSLFVLGCITGIIATYGYYKYHKSTPIDNHNSNETISDYHGIDVSNHQGIIDWRKVATDKNIQFVYIKATEGATYIDKSYKRNITEARKNGLKVGSYHYLRNISPVVSQFQNFINVVNRDSQNLIPMVDVEDSISKDSIRLFCKLVEDHYGKKPVIYGTNKSYNLYCAPDFNDYILMIGRYGPKKPVIKGSGHYDIWQFSEKGKIPGISKNVDLDRFHPNFSVEKLYLK